MKAVVAEANTSVAPAIQPGSVSGRITWKKVRHFEAPSAREASTRFWSIWFMIVSSGSSISGISICVSAMTRPISVWSRLSGATVSPRPISVWLTTPSRARITIHEGADHDRGQEGHQDDEDQHALHARPHSPEQ